METSEVASPPRRKNAITSSPQITISDEQSPTERRNGVEEDQYEVLTRLSQINDIPKDVREAIKVHTPKISRRRLCVEADQHHSIVLMLDGGKSMKNSTKESIEEAKYTIEGRINSEKRRKALAWTKSF